MKIDVLYFKGCPNHLPAVELVKEVVAELGITAEIAEVLVCSHEEAVKHRFFGSPSIQVDGKDIDPNTHGRSDYSFSCRVYGTSGLPSREMLMAALGGNDAAPVKRSGMLAAGGSVAAAIASSACCWLPLLLIAFGVSASGVAAWFEQYRPLLLTVAVLLLALGFYLVYRRQPVCASGSACATPRPGLRRMNQVVLWVAAILVGGFAFFPNYASWFITQSNAQLPVTTMMPGSQSLTLNIEGMTCEACAVVLQNKLASVPGVLGVQVSYAQRQATLRLDPDQAPTPNRLVAVVEQTGYRVATAHVEPPEP